MKKVHIRRYKCSIACIIIVWILCLIPIPEIEIAEDVPFFDKWTHILMYWGTCMAIWSEYLWAHKGSLDKKRILGGAILLPILMSGLIELVQAYCTGGRRSGDWLDFAANATGVFLAALFCYFILRKIFLRIFS